MDGKFIRTPANKEASERHHHSPSLRSTGSHYSTSNQIWYQLHRVLKPVTRATSFKILLQTTKQALMTVLGCQKVSFMLKHSEIIDAAIRENFILETVKIELCKKFRV
jgi:hypothetical protein